MESLSRHEGHKACKLKLSKALSPHAHSEGPTIRSEERDDMSEGVTARSTTEEAPDTEKHHPFEDLDCYHAIVNYHATWCLN